MSGSKDNYRGEELRRYVATHFPDCYVITRKTNNHCCRVIHGPTGIEVIKEKKNFDCVKIITAKGFKLPEVVKAKKEGTLGIAYVGEVKDRTDRGRAALRDFFDKILEAKEYMPGYDLVEFGRVILRQCEKIQREFEETNGLQKTGLLGTEKGRKGSDPKKNGPDT